MNIILCLITKKKIVFFDQNHGLIPSEKCDFWDSEKFFFYSVKRFLYYLHFDFQIPNGPHDPFIKTKQTSFSVFFYLRDLEWRQRELDGETERIYIA